MKILILNNKMHKVHIIPLMNTKRIHWWMNREPITLTTAIKTRNVHELNETGSLNTQGNLMTDSWT